MNASQPEGDTSDQQYSDCADANGNLKAVLGGACTAGNWYDVENRVLSPNSNAPVGGSGGSETFYYYSYAPGNKRVWRGSWVLTGSSGSRGTDIVAFYAPNGQKLAEYSLASYYGAGGGCNPEDPVFYATQTGTYYYFGGRMIKNESGWVYPDRLGSMGKFYPYGTERPSATTNGTEKFTGYFRDAETGNDYADQRYHLPGQGRFMTDDPSANSWDLANPQSWNTYAYMAGDPINGNDPTGLGPVTLPPVVPGVNCSTAFINYAAQLGETIQQLFDSDAGILGLMNYFEQQGSGSKADQQFGRRWIGCSLIAGIFLPVIKHGSTGRGISPRVLRRP